MALQCPPTWFLRSLATGHGLGTISGNSDIARFVQGGVVKPSVGRCNSIEMADDWTSLATQIASDTNATFVVIANADGDTHAHHGDLDHADFLNLLDVHCATPGDVRRSYQSLAGIILPQCSAQGDAKIFRHRPTDGILVLVGKLLPRPSDADNESFATLIYETGRSLDETVGEAFRQSSGRLTWFLR